MDAVLAKALERRKILQVELEELDRFIVTYRRLLGTDSENQEPVGDVNSEYKLAPNVTIVRKRHGRPVQFARIMEGILKDGRRPLNRAAMVAEIEARNVEIPSADKPRYVGTILWRERSKFVHIVDHGYWLKYTALPEIGYDPRRFGSMLESASNIRLDHPGTALL
jgi:hypothetical protein